jgi:CRISPR-associated protein Cas2
MLDRLNAYRIMWIIVFFDLPTETATERKVAAQFRKNLLQDGFIMFQYSIYIRHCASKENADVHTQRVKKVLPNKGHIVMLSITDKQFGNMELFYGKKISKPPEGPQQLELF